MEKKISISEREQVIFAKHLRICKDVGNVLFTKEDAEVLFHTLWMLVYRSKIVVENIKHLKKYCDYMSKTAYTNQNEQGISEIEELKVLISKIEIERE